MSATQRSSTKDNSARHRISLVAAVLAATALAFTGSALTGTPSQAATTKKDCTVTPLKPVLLHNGHEVRYSIKVQCTKPDTTVKVSSQPWERDGKANPDDKLGHPEVIERHIPNANPVTIHYIRTVPNTENGDEEVYHAVRFQVRPPFNLFFDSWSQSENSADLTINQ